jgi:hypothetical protein
VQNRDKSDAFLSQLESQGVKFAVKAVRNLKKEGLTTASVAADPSAHCLNTRDLDD